MTATLTVSYEACRSPSGVPVAVIPFAWQFVQDSQPEAVTHFIIGDAIEILDIRAAEAHPDNPEMWMPSHDARDYVIRSRDGAACERLSDIPWRVTIAGHAADVVLCHEPKESDGDSPRVTAFYGDRDLVYGTGSAPIRAEDSPPTGIGRLR